MGKVLQTINSVVVGLVAWFFASSILSSFISSTSFSLSFLSFFGLILSIIYFILLMFSFKEDDLSKRGFALSGILNLVWFCGLVLILVVSFLIGDWFRDLSDILASLPRSIIFSAGAIYFISFVVFIISYFSYKK